MKTQITDPQFEEITTKIVLEYAETASNELLHQMAAQWNGSHKFLEWLVNRPNTDKATALMIYWMAGSRWWKQYPDKEYLLKNDIYSSGFDFTEDLEHKILTGFYINQQFAFDPTVADDSGTTWANEYLDKDRQGNSAHPIDSTFGQANHSWRRF